MLAKILLGIFLVAHLAAYGECDRATKRCFKQTDCDIPRECCSKRLMQDEAYCVPRRRLGEICMDFGMDEMMINKTYVITCPCEKELSCIKEKWLTESGQLLYQRNPRCREPTFEQPPLEYYLGPNTVNTGASSGFPTNTGVGNSNARPLTFPANGNTNSFADPGSYANTGVGNSNARPLILPANGNTNAFADPGSYGSANAISFSNSAANTGSNDNINSEAYVFEYRRK